jgi:hypothetical protein
MRRYPFPVLNIGHLLDALDLPSDPLHTGARGIATLFQPTTLHQVLQGELAASAFFRVPAAPEIVIRFAHSVPTSLSFPNTSIEHGACSAMSYFSVIAE